MARQWHNDWRRDGTSEPRRTDLDYPEAGRIDSRVAEGDRDALRMKLEKMQKPLANSKNSSQPPSRDQKSGKLVNRPKRKHGPVKGHEKHERKFVAKPDHTVELKAGKCSACHADLHEQAGKLVDVNQIIELPPAKAEVIEVRQYEEVACQECGHLEIALAPEGLEMARTFGTHLEATVTYYRQKQHMSYERTEQTLFALHGVEISRGGIDQIMQRGGKKAKAEVSEIQALTQKSKVVNSDETGSRIDGQKAWEWVFCTAEAILHVIKFSRGVDVIQDVMGDPRVEIWGSDCLPSQLNAPAWLWQICLAHTDYGICRQWWNSILRRFGSGRCKPYSNMQSICIISVTNSL